MKEQIINLLGIENFNLKENTEKSGIEIYFTEYPGKDVINTLKDNSFRWSAFNKCWYIKSDLLGNKKESKTEVKNTLKSLRMATPEEVQEIAKELWDTQNMQDYIIKSYDFYITSDGLYIEFEKVNKLSIEKTIWYDDETEAPEITHDFFIRHNLQYNDPARGLDNYLSEKERLMTNGCATGQYDYTGIYLVECRTNNKKLMGYAWHDDKRYFKRYLTEDEQQDFITIMESRKQDYINRLEKYWKRYGKNVYACGYWVNR